MSQSDIKINLKFVHIQLVKIQYHIKKQKLFVINRILLFAGVSYF